MGAATDSHGLPRDIAAGPICSQEYRKPFQILGFTKLLMNEIEGPLGAPGYKDYAGHIHRAAGGLNRLLSDMLLLTRALANELKILESEMPIRNLVEDVVEHARANSDAAEIVIVEKIPDAQEAILQCDTGLIMRALEHMIENALKFSPEGAPVHIANMLAASGAVILTVQDQGPGFDDVNVEDLTQPFNQGEMSKCRTKDGAGIGLAITKIAAEAHGGRLLVHSKPDSGATVGLVLPANRLVRHRPQEPLTSVG